MLNGFSFGKNNLSGGIPPSIGNLTSLEHLFFPSCPLGGSIPDYFRHLKNLRRLGLGEMGLVGAFPSFLFNLSKLEHLNLPQNELVGSLPSSLCLSQPHFKRLEIAYNNLSGFLPSSISNCSEFESYDVFDKDFKGEIVADFGKLRYLRGLSLGRIKTKTKTKVGIGGIKFFDSLSNCSKLQVLEIEDVQLRRELPNWLGNLTELRYLRIQSSYISGNLSPSIGNLVRLILLSLDGNNFTGIIPESIGKLRNVGILSLDDNHFCGIIPGYIGNLSSLTVLDLSRNSLEVELDLSQNNLSGVLPQDIGILKNLATLDFSKNRLGGDLSSSLSSCISLQFLNLSNNLFNGSMPEALSSLRGLENVDLSRNNFSGKIPKYLQEISLKHLDLSYNDFEGEVSVEGVFPNTSGILISRNNKLCGGIPELHLPKCPSRDSKRSRKLYLGVVVAISLSSTVAGLIVVSFVLFHYFEKKKKNKKKEIPSEPMLTKSFEKISYESLFKATEGFSPHNLVGTGSFASVYKGVFEENCLTMAIKVLNLQRRGGSKSFQAECDALRNVRHRNLVKVITSCSSLDFQGNDFKALVYDFMPNGNLDSWLHINTTNHNELYCQQLDLVQRISIAKYVASALDYLHYRCGNVVVHCDLKPNNILLDADMIAHVGDFGLAKIISLEEVLDGNKSASSLIRGTIGYAPPEYGLGNEVSTNGDMYSYEILLLEMLTGKRPVDPMFQEGLSLHSYAKTALANGTVFQVVDPMLLNNDDVKEKCLISLLKIRVQCSSESPQDRTNIQTVIRELLLVMSCYSSRS